MNIISNGTELQAEQRIDIENDRAVDNLSQRMMNPKLMALRAQNPFVEIIPFPNSGTSVRLVANVAQDIQIPSGTKYMMLRGDLAYFITRNGNAQVPGAAQNSDAAMMQSPNNIKIYVEELQSFSVVAPADCYFTANFFAQL